MSTHSAVSCMFLIVCGLLTLLAGILAGSTSLACIGALSCLGGYLCQPDEPQRPRNVRAS